MFFPYHLRIALLLTWVACGSNFLCGQVPADTLTHRNALAYVDKGGKLEFKQSGRSLKRRELLHILNGDYEASEYVGKYKTKNIISAPLGFLAGACIGYPFGQLIAGGEPTWVIAATGLGFLMVAIPISLSAKKDLKRGVDVYNSNLRTSTRKPAPHLQLGKMAHGMGIGWRF